MTTTMSQVVATISFKREQEEWLMLRHSLSNTAGYRADELLQHAQSTMLPPLRYARMPMGDFLLGEYPLSSESDRQTDAEAALTRWLRGERVADCEADADAIETILSESTPGWIRRDDQWYLPQDARRSHELRIASVSLGVRVDCPLTRDAIVDPVCRQATAEFLCRAQSHLRFTRLELTDVVTIVSEVDASSLAFTLPHSLHSVAVACRAVATECQSLGVPELAQAYLSMIQRQSECRFAEG